MPSANHRKWRSVMTISVVVPTYGEGKNIGRLIRALNAGRGSCLVEVIVVDAGSGDGTREVCTAEGADFVYSSVKSRAAQMNLGASRARGDVLYFVHADVRICPTFTSDIEQAVLEGFGAGCYRYRFDSPKWALKINAYMTRFSPLWCRGGDQTLFITKKLFSDLGGFRSDYQIMEDYDMISRIRKSYRFRIIPKDIVVSARKYETNGYLRVQFANFLVFTMYFWGASQQVLVKTYQRLLNLRMH